MNYEIVTLQEKIVVGVMARTSHTAPQCQQIIGGLWRKFMEDGIWASIRNKANPYCVGLYSGYDETSYDVTVGAEVTKNGNPQLVEKIIPASNYAVFCIRGDVVKDVSEAWDKIWTLPLERSFTCDFEEYLSNENGVAEIKIYIALK